MAGQKKSDRGRRAPAAAAEKPRYYNEAVVRELVKLWELLNYSCGKRLVAIMPEVIAKLEQFGETNHHSDFLIS